MIRTLLSGISDVGSSLFRNFNYTNQPAQEAPQITNIQTVGERESSGSENYRGQVMQANPLAAFGPQVVLSLIHI